MFKFITSLNVAAALMLASGVLFVSTSQAWSQSADTEPSSSAENSNETADAIPENQAELDALLLGPWVYLTADTEELPDEKTTLAALARCLTIPKFNQLDIEPEADKKLPKAADLGGDIVYYRTEKGLQRFEFGRGRVFLMTEIKKTEKDLKIVWTIQGNVARFALRFANTENRGGKGKFMLENGKLFLRCRPAHVEPPENSEEN